MKRRNSKTKYSIGSLLLLLAFAFYVACNPDKKEQRPKDKEATERLYKNDTLTTFQGKVIGIKDGDTFEVLYNGQPEKIRLYGIDCPESAQPFGKAAKKYASDLSYGKIVTVIPQKKRDKYGRILGTVITPDSLNVNEQMIRNGMAWKYKYSKDKHLKALQQEAKEQRKGLWADNNAMDPWQWRKLKRQNF